MNGWMIKFVQPFSFVKVLLMVLTLSEKNTNFTMYEIQMKTIYKLNHQFIRKDNLKSWISRQTAKRVWKTYK